IDSKRIYVTGQSMGGFGTFAAIVQRPDLFAAAVPVCGGHQPENAEKIAGVPIWVFHGAKDTGVPVKLSRDMVEAIRKAGGDPKYTEYPNVGHNAWTPAYATAELWEWVFEQRKE
ncbi:MAG: prolyl oligopeptidase family serine peptidase, partial [Verrucomicrobiota bacterium]